MSTFEPVNEDLLKTCATDPGRSTLFTRLAQTALHHLARAKAAEAELTDLRAGLRAAHAERDAVTVERDEAYRQRDEAKRLAEVAAIGERMQGRVVREVRAALGAFDIETTEGAAERVMAQTSHATIILRNALVDGADTIEDLASIARAQFFDLRTILGATDNETLSDAARRVVAARDSLAEPDPHKTVLEEVRAALVVPYGESVVAKAKWIMEARAMSHKMQSEREDEIDRLRKRVTELEAIEAEPAQTFRLKNYRVRIQRDGEKVWVKLFIDPICAPEIASLSAEQLSSLALVVARG